MPNFRKKPVEIEAEKISVLIKNAHDSNCPAQPVWVRKAVDENTIIFGEDHVYIKTLEGTMRGEAADYLIKGIQGELYPCKPDVFEQTYESIDNTPYDLGDVH